MKIKILALSHQMDYSGAPLALLNLCQNLIAKGFDVSYLSLKNGPLEKDFLLQGIVQHNSNKSYDAVIGNTILCLPALSKLSKKVVRILWLHETIEFLDILKVQKTEILSLATIDLVLYLAEFQKKQFDNIINTNAWMLFRNNVNAQHSEYEKVHKETKITIPGKIEHRKNQVEFLNKLNHLPDNFSIILLGASKLSYPTQDERILFTDSISHAESLEVLKNSDIVISNSLYESQNLVAIEAMIIGRRVLLKNNDAHQELKRLFPEIEVYSSIDELLDLIKLKKSPALLKKISVEADKIFGKTAFEIQLIGLINFIQTRIGINMKNKWVSVLTVVKDADHSILKTFESLKPLLQSNDLEWIIKSADENVVKFRDIWGFPNVVVKIMPDTGIYNAMNQGVAQCTSEYIQIIGSGDLINLNGMRVLLDYLQKSRHQNPDIMYCSAYMAHMKKVWIPDPNQMKARMSCPHASTFVKQKLLKLNVFNETFKIAGDYDLMLRLLLAGSTYETVNTNVVDCDGDGISVSSPVEAYLEEELSRIRNLKSSLTESLHRLLYFTCARLGIKISKKQ